MKLKVGIIGFGFMGHCHEQTINKLENAELVAVCDINEAQLADAKERGVSTYSSAEELLSIKEINTVIIAVPNHLHWEMVEKAAKHGKNIICEKPAAMSVEEFDKMLESVKEAGVLFTVHQQRRWDKDFRISKEVYDRKTVGDVYTIKSCLYGFNGNMHDWHVYKEYGGGMLFDWGVHLLDQILFMVDSKIKTVYADLKNVINTEVDDYFNIMLKFENGISAQIELGTYYLADKERWFERHWFIGGNTGSMSVDGFDCFGNITRTTSLLQNVPGKITMSFAGPTRSFGPPREGLLVTEPLPEVNTDHIMFFQNYINALDGKEEFVVKPSEVRRVLALMEAVRKSAETGKSIDFE